MFLSAEMLIPARKIEDYFTPIRENVARLVDALSLSKAAKSRASLPRMAKLVEWGIVRAGMPLHIKRHEDSEAVVRDAKTVQFKDANMSFNDWGQKVTGWSSICIYDWATTPEGKTLSELRTRRMEEEEKLEKDAPAIPDQPQAYSGALGPRRLVQVFRNRT
jgi:hypothetical protein